MKTEKPYYRKKKKKIVIEKKVNGKTIYIKTLPPADEYEITWRLANVDKNASFSSKESPSKVHQKVAQSLLNEPTEEEIAKTLGEIKDE